MKIAEEIAVGAIDAGKRRDHDLFLIPDRRAAIQHALSLARPGDIVLLAGKGHERSIIGPGGPRPWNERGEAEAVLRNALSQAAPRQPLTKEGAEALRAAGRKQAEINLKRHLILDKVSEIEGLRASEDEIDAEIEALAKANNIPLARAVESFEAEGRRESLKHTLRDRKTIDFLLGQAIME